MMAEQMKAAVAAPPTVSSTGLVAGNGKEILLQTPAVAPTTADDTSTQPQLLLYGCLVSH
jgi:hypothetical protein